MRVILREGGGPGGVQRGWLLDEPDQRRCGRPSGAWYTLQRLAGVRVANAGAPRRRTRSDSGMVAMAPHKLATALSHLTKAHLGQKLQLVEEESKNNP